MNKNMLVMVIAIALSLSACGGLGDDFTGDIIVLSDPGATVFLNNNNVGTVGNSGELLLQNLETRSHTLRASLSGHNHITKTVQVIRDDTIVVELYFDTDSGCVIDNDCDSGYVCIEGECTKAHELDLRIEGYGGVIVSVGENPFVAQQLGEHYNVFYECDDDEGCAFIVPEGYVISLEGSPSSGWEFDTWSELGVYADYIQATIMESAVFTAVFKKRENGVNDVSCTDDDGCDEGYACVQGECRQTHELDLRIEGYGGVIVSVGENPFVAQDEGEHHEILFECAEDCKNMIPEGYVLLLEAVSNAGWEFVEWKETGYSGTYNQFYVDEPTIVTAVFKEEDNGGENGKACDYNYDCEPGYLCIDKKCVSGQNLSRVRVTD